MPGFSNIIGGLAKAAVEQIGNRRQQQGGDAHNQSNYNSGGGYSSPSQGYDPYNPQSAYSNPNAYSGQQQGGYSNQQSAYGGAQPHGAYPQSNAYGGGYSSSPYPSDSYNQGYNNQPTGFQPNAGGGQIGFNVGNTGSNSSLPYPNSDYQPGYPPSSNQHGQSMYPPINNPSSNYQPYPSAQPHGQSYHQSPSQNSFHQQQQFHHQQPAMAYSNPSIKPYPHFNASHDAEALRKAMKGLGCDKNRVLEILCKRSNMQRQEIARVFKTMYGKDLIADLKSELHGDFEDLILALMELPVVYDAHQLHKAMHRIGTRENVLIEIMTTRTNAQIQQLKQTYRQLYGKELEDHLISETSGYFKRLLISMCAGGRDESGRTDQLKANQDARSLYRAGEQRLGTDEAQFNAILAAQNFHQLRLVFDEYKNTTGGHTIEQAVQTEFSGDIRDGLLAIIKCVRNRAAYFAELLNDSMKGLGTRDTDLIRIIVTRSEVDLGDIRNEFQKIYGKSLESAIAGDCSGAYKDGLIALVKGN
ncbi:Annexin [Aphelenchoides fujianensis]|nr:Annexin [Aphelenchoides fujianensis]